MSEHVRLVVDVAVDMLPQIAEFAVTVVLFACPAAVLIVCLLRWGGLFWLRQAFMISEIWAVVDFENAALASANALALLLLGAAHLSECRQRARLRDRIADSLGAHLVASIMRANSIADLMRLFPVSSGVSRP